MVIAADSIGMPARSAQIRATFMPCSASGMAQPMITSSTSDLSSAGILSRAPSMAAAPRSSGRVARSIPLGALPTAVRTALTITASLILVTPLIPQRLPGFQREANPLLRLLLAAQREERFPLQIQQVLLAHQRARRDLTAAQHVRHPIGDLRVVIADKLAFAHDVDPEFQRRQHAFPRRRNVRAREWRPVTRVRDG